MKELFKKIGKFILGIIVIPVAIVLLTIIALGYVLVSPFILLPRFIKYRKSSYYKSFKLPYKNKIYFSDEYVFYNYAIEEGLDIKYIKQSNNSLDYFIYNDVVYIFPDFTSLQYNNEDKEYDVIYKRYRGDAIDSLNGFINKKRTLFEEKINLPVKVLLAKSYLEESIDISELPDTILLINSYDSAFNYVIHDQALIPKTTKALYKVMKKNNKLGGKFQLLNESIVWTFDDVIYNIEIKDNEGYFIVKKTDELNNVIAHWEADLFDTYIQVCLIGEKGNVLVIKEDKALYMGPKEKCKYKQNKSKKMYYFGS